MEKKPIAYEPHPVTPQRKAELVAAGYRIIDLKFAPPAARAERDGADVEADTEDRPVEDAPADAAPAAVIKRTAKKAAKKARRH